MKPKIPQEKLKKTVKKVLEKYAEYCATELKNLGNVCDCLKGKPKIPQEIKRLCDNFNKGSECWEDYFPREIQALISFFQARLLEELPEEEHKCGKDSAPEAIYWEKGFNTCLLKLKRLLK